MALNDSPALTDSNDESVDRFCVLRRSDDFDQRLGALCSGQLGLVLHTSQHLIAIRLDASETPAAEPWPVTDR
ncbi:hypothetical protein ABIB25_003083 [Nakamurella sp. UYEF19]|uniref:hypothetical protein n=1 Tax=Nakamurella sp. UYEF19 TaxID=1756392 RepID=UPI003398C737